MDMTDFVRETCEKDFEKEVKEVVLEEMDVDEEDDREMGPEQEVGLSDDEEEFSDGGEDDFDSE